MTISVKSFSLIYTEYPSHQLYRLQIPQVAILYRMQRVTLNSRYNFNARNSASAQWRVAKRIAQFQSVKCQYKIEDFCLKIFSIFQLVVEVCFVTNKCKVQARIQGTMTINRQVCHCMDTHILTLL